MGTTMGTTMGTRSALLYRLFFAAALLWLWASVAIALNWDDFESDPACLYKNNSDGVSLEDNIRTTRICKLILTGPVVVTKLSRGNDDSVQVFLEDRKSKRLNYERVLEANYLPMRFVARKVGLVHKMVGHEYYSVKTQFEVRTGTQAWELRKIDNTLAQLPSAKVETEKIVCANGGLRLDDHDLGCDCPPGFAGLRCEKACGPDRYGDGCKDRCSGDLRGCRGITFCRVWSSLCYCASGFRSGQRECDSECSNGWYGANCGERCGHCEGNSTCDRYTGFCTDGCEPGYSGASCHDVLPYLLAGLNLTHADEVSLNGLLTISPENVAGQGHVEYYEIQFKEVGSSGWQRSSVGRLTDPTLKTPQQFQFTISGLRSNVEVDVRVVLLDADMRGFTSAGYFLRGRTNGPGRVSDLRLTEASVLDNTTVRVRVNWTSPAARKKFSVKYMITEMLGCDFKIVLPNGIDGSGEVNVSEHRSVTLDDLQPGTRYRVTVTDEDQWDSLEFTTPVLAPRSSSPISSLRVELLTNSSAVIRWDVKAHARCVPWLISGFEWALHDRSAIPSVPLRTGNTSAPLVALDDLEALNNYELHVVVISPHGPAPTEWSRSTNFTTLPTAPDKPRDFAVYRANRTSLWLHWRPPARPSGKLQHYTVTVEQVTRQQPHSPQQTRSEKVAVDSKCAAYPEDPDLVCHGMHRLRPNTQYVVSAAATNEYPDQPGERAVISASTVRGVSSPPQELESLRRDSHSVTVRWRQPQLVFDPFYFEVQMTRRWDDDSMGVADPEPVRVHVAQEQSHYEYTATALQPDSSYQIAVSCGYGGQPTRLDVSTLPDEVANNVSVTQTVGKLRSEPADEDSS